MKPTSLFLLLILLFILVLVLSLSALFYQQKIKITDKNLEGIKEISQNIDKIKTISSLEKEEIKQEVISHLSKLFPNNDTMGFVADYNNPYFDIDYGRDVSNNELESELRKENFDLSNSIFEMYDFDSMKILSYNEIKKELKTVNIEGYYMTENEYFVILPAKNNGEGMFLGYRKINNKWMIVASNH